MNHNILVGNMITELTRGNPAAVPATGAQGEFPVPHGEGYVFTPSLFSAPRITDGEDPARLWNRERDRVLQALDQPGALASQARGPWGHDTVDDFLGFAFYDPLVHTWDLARAVQQDVHLDAGLVDRALSMLEDPGDGRQLRQPISLGPPVATTAQDTTSRLIALTGRDPSR